MYSYMLIKKASEDDTHYKKFRTIFDDTVAYPYNMVQGKIINRTITGNINKQIGPRYKEWIGTFKVKAVEDTGYGTLEELLEFLNSTTAANHLLVIKDHTGTTANATSVIDFQPRGGNSYPEGAGGFYYVPYDFQQRDAT